jgi:4-amino-4-deoxy-L-arabinose transferase-like glycosyltransferase
LLATCPGWYALSQYVVLDMPLAAFVCAGLAAFWRGWSEFHKEYAHPPSRAFLIGAAALFGLGTLVKGPIAVVLAAMVVGPVLLTKPRQAVRLPWGRMIAVYLLVTAPWFFAIGRKHPEFWHFFFVHEHLQRFLEPGHARPGPVWYFLPVLVAGLFPWSCLAPAGWFRPPRLKRGAGVLLAAWILLPVAFFSLSKSKLPAYVLPVFPALAVWLAAVLEPLLSGERAPGRTLALGSGLVVAAAIAVVAKAMTLHPSDQRALIAIRGLALMPVVGCGLGGVLAMALFWRGRVRGGFEVLLAIALVGLTGLGLVAPHYEPTKDCKVLAAELARVRPPGEPLMVYGTLESAGSLPFYVRGPVLVGGHHYGELRFAQQEPRDGERERFVPAWRVEELLKPDAPRIWVVSDKGVYRDWFLWRLGLKPKLVREYGGRVLFTNR